MCIPRDDMKPGHRHHGATKTESQRPSGTKLKPSKTDDAVNRASKIDFRAALYALQPHAYPETYAKATHIPSNENKFSRR